MADATIMATEMCDDNAQQSWQSAMEHVTTMLDPKLTALPYWQAGTRSDGRLWTQCRPVRIQHGIVRHPPHYTSSKDTVQTTTATMNRIPSTLAGSAMVHMGGDVDDLNTINRNNNNCTATGHVATTNSTTSAATAATVVLAAVSWQIGQPVQDPYQGDLIVSVAMEDMAFKIGSSSGAGQIPGLLILQSFLQRTLDSMWMQHNQHPQQSNGEEPSSDHHHHFHHQLCILPGVAAYRLHVTVQILQHAGNIRDAALLACIAALQDTTLPYVRKHPIQELNGHNKQAINTNNLDTDCPFVWQDGTLSIKPLHLCPPPQKLQFKILPVCLTMGLWRPRTSIDNNHTSSDGSQIRSQGLGGCGRGGWLVDLDRDEEYAVYSRCTITINVLQPDHILGMELGGGGEGGVITATVAIHDEPKHAAVQTSDLALAIHMAMGRARELQELLRLDSDRV